MGTTAEKLAYLNDTKNAIKDAIVSKGVEVPGGTTFRQYADLISGISTGLSDEDLALADATPEDVTAEKTFYAGDRTLKTGTASAGLELKLLYSGDKTTGVYFQGEEFLDVNVFVFKEYTTNQYVAFCAASGTPYYTVELNIESNTFRLQVETLTDGFFFCQSGLSELYVLKTNL